MIDIKPECHLNAVGMLKSKPSYFLGWIGDVRYYLVDGKAWSLTPAGQVARSDDSEETDHILLSFRKATPNE